jgi:hypothetical protein
MPQKTPGKRHRRPEPHQQAQQAQRKPSSLNLPTLIPLLSWAHGRAQHLKAQVNLAATCFSGKADFADFRVIPIIT